MGVGTIVLRSRDEHGQVPSSRLATHPPWFGAGAGGRHMGSNIAQDPMLDGASSLKREDKVWNVNTVFCKNKTYIDVNRISTGQRPNFV